MRRSRSCVLILALAFPAALSTRSAGAQTAPPPAAAPAQPAAPPPASAPATAAPAPAAPIEPVAPAAPAAMPAPDAMPAPVETAIPPPVETKPAGPPPAAQAPATVVATPSASPPAEAPLPRFGVTVGIIALPRPIEIEATWRALDALSVSAQYAMLPDLTAPGGSAKLQLRAFQGIARWFPFSGSFFLGSGIGFQTFKASLSKTVDNGVLTTELDLSGVFVSPQLGWLFVWRSGFALGLSIGAQVPLPKDPVATSTYNGQKVPDQAGPGFSQKVVDESNDNKDTVVTLGKFANKYPIPNLELLRIGFFF